mmetsp:Transcript_18237/g.29706  ORF Transcript_18237/g.29706 Transcript_18237/m.29706 type:complete len:571 (+) Transcript_18237:190-1902(+)
MVQPKRQYQQQCFVANYRTRRSRNSRHASSSSASSSSSPTRRFQAAVGTLLFALACFMLVAVVAFPSLHQKQQHQHEIEDRNEEDRVFSYSPFNLLLFPRSRHHHPRLLALPATKQRKMRLPKTTRIDDPSVKTKDLKYFAKRRNDFVRNDPSVRMTKAHLAKLDRKRKKKFQPPRQDPTKVLLDRAPIDNSTGEIRLRDWSDSEYEEKMVEGDKYQQLYKDLGHSLPHPRFVAKKIRMEKRDKREAINLQPWGDQDPVQEFIQLKRDLNGGREEDNKRLKKEVKRLKVALKHGHDHVVRKVSNELMEEAFEKYFIAKLPRHMRRRLTRVSSREQPALARPHPGELLLPEPRAHAELMVQIAEFESKRDPAIAFQWYKKGAEQGNVEALFKLGCHYANGEVPVDRNETKAFEYFKLAADLNHTRSKFYTGLALMFGDGTPTNHIAALQYLTDADKEGDFEAKSYIGFAYEEGLGVKQNHSHAVKIYEDCAALGHKPSRERLAQFKRIEKEYDDMHGGPKPPRPGSRAWKFGGGREKHQAMLREQRRLALLKRAERREMKKKNLDETDPVA